MRFHDLPALCATLCAFGPLGCGNPRASAVDGPATREPAPTVAATDAEETHASPDDIPPLLAFTMEDIDGRPFRLADYRGKVVLVVNVASKCGFTPQYTELQALQAKYASRGLVVIGVPANDFGGQEPGTNEQIQEFCTSRYGVTFPMMAKVSVKGDAQVPLYAALTSPEHNPDDAGPVKWNFEKFLIGRDGHLATMV